MKSEALEEIGDYEFNQDLEIDTTLSQKFFKALIKRYGREKSAEICGVKSLQVGRLSTGFRGLLPSKNIRRRIAEFSGRDIDEITRVIIPVDKNSKLFQYQNIRDAICENAFYFDQFEEVFFSKDLTNEEIELITFFFLLHKGIKYLSNTQKYEVLTDGYKERALEYCQSLPNLVEEFSQTLGPWYKKNNRYYFQNLTSRGTGIQFLQTFEELINNEALDVKIKNRLKEGFIFIDTINKIIFNSDENKDLQSKLINGVEVLTNISQFVSGREENSLLLEKIKNGVIFVDHLQKFVQEEKKDDLLKEKLNELINLYLDSSS